MRARYCRLKKIVPREISQEPPRQYVQQRHNQKQRILVEKHSRNHHKRKVPITKTFSKFSFQSIAHLSGKYTP
jgi:hypothetical protein